MVNDKRPDDFIEAQEQDTEGHIVRQVDGPDDEKGTEGHIVRQVDGPDDEDTEGHIVRQ